MLFRRSRQAAASVIPPDYNGIPLPPPSTHGFVSNQQDRMWDYVHGEGLARFPVAFVADAGSRVELKAERYVPELGGWVQDFETPEAAPYKNQAQYVKALIDMMRGRYTGPARTLWTIIWHKRGVGEVMIATEPHSLYGMTYTPYSYKSCKPETRDGMPGWKIEDRPGGTYKDGGARWLPQHLVNRIWEPHPDWPLLPYSSLWAGLKDLDRHKLMSNVIDRAANSALIQRGLMWYPGEAMEETVAKNGRQVPKMALDYYEAAQQTMTTTNNASPAAIAPFLVWWDSDLGKPERIDFKLPFDEQWLDVRNTTIEDFARSVDLPSIIVSNGGAGGGQSSNGGNHWSELLVDRRTFDLTVGRDLDGVCHDYLTRVFLLPQLQAQRPNVAPYAPPAAEAIYWRIGYDPTRVIVNQDLSLKAMDAYRMGIINWKACAKRLGFRLDEAATEEDRQRLAELVSRSAETLGITRVRRRTTESNDGGNGSSVNPPITAASIGEAVRAILSENGPEMVWLAD